jgi:FHA domain-containing protein
MQPFAIEPDDRAFAVARGGVVLASSPSAVADGSAVQAAGADAWRTVRQLPTTTSTRHLGTVLREAQPSARALSLVLAEVARRLAAHPPAAGERIWIAAPAGAERFGLGALLGVARQLALPVDGFVDAAVVSAAALGGTGAAIVVELGLHHVAATLIERDAGPTCRRRSLLSPRGGLWQLYQGWLDLINTAMVRQTRFDALHDAATEQQLFDALPRLARDAMAQGVAAAALTTAGGRVEVPVTRDQLAHAAQPVWREIARLLHELRPAGSALTLLVPRAVAEFPGVREALAQFAGCELVSLPDGFAAAATSLLDLPPRGATEPVRLLRRLPAGAEPALAALAARESAQADAPGLAPSHVLFAGRTYALGAEPLVVGRAPGAAHAITLAEGLAGVSRRHCTFLRDGAELLLLDHSRFGSFVNGERVAERARVRAGDEVRVGDPGVTLALIAVADAAPGSRA